jgi:hypothetical protein
MPLYNRAHKEKIMEVLNFNDSRRARGIPTPKEDVRELFARHVEIQNQRAKENEARDAARQSPQLEMLATKLERHHGK